MRLALLIAGLALFALPVAAPAEDPAFAPVCRTGDRPVSYHQGWPQTSDTICDYDFAEANRRLADLLEAPRSAVRTDWLKWHLGIPDFMQREGYEPNEFYVVNAGYYVVLAGARGWDMVVELYENRREGAWGSKDSVTVRFHSTVPTSQLDAKANPGCLTEAALLDRAIAAGWHYVPGSTESGTAGPIFVPGALATDDGRSLVLANLSRTSVLPARETLEASCAWILSFSEMVEVRK